MVECQECGKKLGIFEGYNHPTMGDDHQVCGPCYDMVDESVAKWREFVLENSFKNPSEMKLRGVVFKLRKLYTYINY